MRTVVKQDRVLWIDSLLPCDGEYALDVGAGQHLAVFYGDRQFRGVVAVNAWEPMLRELQQRFAGRQGWEFICQDIRHYRPDRMFDAITMLHVAEHLDLYDLGIVLDRLTAVCRGPFVLETPEQYESNEREAFRQCTPWELHRSLVTAEYLAKWDFAPVFRYWQNDRFSNAVYLRERDGK